MNRRFILLSLLLAALCIGGWFMSRFRQTAKDDAVSANNPTRQSSGRPSQPSENPTPEALRRQHAEIRLNRILTSLRTQGKMPDSEMSSEDWDVLPEILVGLLNALKSAEFDGAWGTLPEEEAQKIRLRIQTTNIWKLAEQDPIQALELALKSGAKDRHVKHELLCRVVPHIAIDDPQQAAQWMEEIPAGPSRTDALKGIAFYWSKQDLDATFAWTGQLPQDDRDAVLRSIAPTWAAADGQAAMEHVARIPVDSIFYDTIGGWASHDPESALAWLKQSTDPEQRLAVSRVYSTWAMLHPDAAMQSALQQPPEFRDTAITIVSRYQKPPSPKRQ